jgi:hypothetical protein
MILRGLGEARFGAAIALAGRLLLKVLLFPGCPGALEADASELFQPFPLFFRQVLSDFAGVGHVALLAFLMIPRYQS